MRAALAEAAADEGIARAAAVIVLSAIYWRNTWKYQARGYRHLFWDSGTMLANLLAAASALGQGPRLETGFVDADVNHMLGLDPEHEAALEIVVLGAGAPPAAPAPRLDDIHHDVLPLSSAQVDYPELREAYAASTLASAAEVRRWRAGAPPSAREPRAPLTPLPPARVAAGRTLGETVQRRGSTRQFAHVPPRIRLRIARPWRTSS